MIATAGDATQTEEVLSGGSYLSQNDLRLHFGLGRHNRVDKMDVLWPNGTKQTFADLQADKFYEVTEGKDIVQVVYTKK